jgi:hypothetical protein
MYYDLRFQQAQYKWLDSRLNLPLRGNVVARYRSHI